MTSRQDSIIESILKSGTYNDYFDDILLYAEANETDNIVSGVPIARWHSLWEADIGEEQRENLKRSMLTEIAGQFKDGDAISQVFYYTR